MLSPRSASLLKRVVCKFFCSHVENQKCPIQSLPALIPGGCATTGDDGWDYASRASRRWLLGYRFVSKASRRVRRWCCFEDEAAPVDRAPGYPCPVGLPEIRRNHSGS